MIFMNSSYVTWLRSRMLPTLGAAVFPHLHFQQHPSWNFPSKFDNDIAVLELEEDIQFSEFMSYVLS